MPTTGFRLLLFQEKKIEGNKINIGQEKKQLLLKQTSCNPGCNPEIFNNYYNKRANKHLQL